MIRNVLRNPGLYRAWQAPFVKQKLSLVAKYHDLRAVTSVIDVGCGPGTNADQFDPNSYLGVDISREYIRHARSRHKQHRFQVWDITDLSVEHGRFDRVLVNSVFHHLSDEESHRFLQALPALMNESGRIWIVDLVLPDEAGPARWLAKLDRGRYPRRLNDWQSLFERHFMVERFDPFPVGIGSFRLWEMLFVEGTLRRSD
jgi:cyclopropane fatty-acyl-phospholipid synthase-like methyltransferase